MTRLTLALLLATVLALPAATRAQIVTMGGVQWSPFCSNGFPATIEQVPVACASYPYEAEAYFCDGREIMPVPVGWQYVHPRKGEKPWVSREK